MGREGPRRELRFWKGVLPVKYKTTVADSDFSFFFVRSVAISSIVLLRLNMTPYVSILLLAPSAALMV